MKRYCTTLLIAPALLWVCVSFAQNRVPESEALISHPTLARALLEAQQQDYERANQLTSLAELEGADPAEVASVREVIARLKAEQLQTLEDVLKRLLSEQAVSEARATLIQWIALGADQQAIAAYRESIVNIERYGAYTPGQAIQDPWLDGSGQGPQLVVIPEGQFMMGSTDNEPGRQPHEGPRHRVVFESGFVVGLHEVTVAQFRQFVEATGYRTDAERSNRGRLYDPRTRRITGQAGVHWRLDYRGRRADDTLPVIHVSWRDAQAYLAWLSKQTGKPYRLLSEAEFEYVLRAGSQWMYPWGQEMPTRVVGNLAGDGDRSPTQAKWRVAFPDYLDGHWGPAPVAQFEINGLGVHDMVGNVMEWVEDCWHDSYVRAPNDGSAWVNQGCGQHVVRGGSWAATPTLARSAHRMAMGEQESDVRVGFRVARDLSP